MREIQPGHIRQKDANPSNLTVFVDKSIKFGHIGGFSAACAERRRPPPGALALPFEVLKAEAGGRGQRAEGRGRGAHTPAQPEPTRSRSCELEFPTFLTLFLLHSDILAQGMVHAAAIAGHAATESELPVASLFVWEGSRRL